MAVRNTGFYVVLGTMLLFLQGCILPAIPIVGLGYVGLRGYQMYNLAQGGSVEIAFDGQTPSPTVLANMREMRRPAIWPTPGSVAATVLADTLEGLGNYQPKSPSRVEAVLTARQLPADLNRLTARERTTAFNAVCRELGSDSIVANALKEDLVDSTFIGDVWGKRKTRFEIFYHSCSTGQTVFSETLGIVVEISSAGVSEQSVARGAGEVVAARFDGLVRGRTELVSASRN